MTTNHDYPPDELPQGEASRRRDEALKRALATPPKPHKAQTTDRASARLKG